MDSSKIRIALDAMGGDNAPSAIVEGAVAAVEDFAGKFEVILTGPQDVIQAELDRLKWKGTGIEIVHAPQLVAMDDSPADVLKTKKESGLVTCVGLQKKGVVQASISAGNSGAMMAACLMILGRVPGIGRPAIAVTAPSMKGPFVLLDAGANVDERPRQLMDFAVCGSVFAEFVLERENPRVGLLNIGEEEKKGPEVIQETYKLLRESSLNFQGNVEGGDILKGDTDVVVAPGYAGNIVLKLMEGFGHLHQATFGKIDTPEGRDFSRNWDYESYGGALLLGLNGTGIIAHGSASANAIRIALKTAYKFAASGTSEKIAARLNRDET